VTPQTLARYQIQGEIGRGMMGVVYRALDPALGRVVALKTVQSVFPLPVEQQKAFEERFLSEARVAAGLSHPAIVVVHDVGRDPESGALFIAFEYLQGQTLSELTSSGALEWREAFRIAGRLAEALHHAHARDVIHRDISRTRDGPATESRCWTSALPSSPRRSSPPPASSLLRPTCRPSRRERWTARRHLLPRERDVPDGDGDEAFDAASLPSSTASSPRSPPRQFAQPAGRRT
jgi:serine/threonine protein kinase